MRCIATAILFFLSQSSSFAMDFVINDHLGKMTSSNFIYASGEIESDDTDKLKNTLKKLNLYNINNIIMLNSPGGRLFSGMKLGEEIRKYKFISTIGKLVTSSNGDTTIVPGSCNSACTDAFIGGTTRIIPPRGKIGVHQISGDKQHEREAYNALSGYVTKMGVKSEFMLFTKKISSSSIYVLNCDDLIHQNVVTDRCDTRITGLPYFGRNAQAIFKECSKTYKQDGFIGLIVASKNAYAQLASKFTFDSLERCLAIDLFAGALDQSMAKRSNGEQHEYLKADSHQQRIEKFIVHQERFPPETINLMLGEIKSAFTEYIAKNN